MEQAKKLPTGLKISLGIVILIAAGLFTYTVYRAAHVSFTHDESYCYKYYVHNTVTEIILNKMPTANNHVLNTLMMKFCSSVFGESQFVFRLPNLLAYLIYIVFAIALLLRFRNGFVLIAGFVVLNLNPYFLDFFSLARGYGMANGLAMAGMYFLYRYFEKEDNKSLYLSLIISALSVWSNFSMLYFYFAVVVIYNVFVTEKIIREPGKALSRFIRFNKPVLIVTTCLTIVVFWAIRGLVRHKELYGRGTSGFFRDTVISFANGSLYGKHYEFVSAHFVAVVLVVLTALALIAGLIQYRNTRFSIKASPLLIAALFLLLPAVFSMLHHRISDTEFLIYRLTLFYQPLLWTAIILLTIESGKLFSPLPYLFLSFFMIVVVRHAFSTFNLSYASEWKYDACTQTMLRDLEKEKKNSPQPGKVSLGIEWLFEPSVNFYIDTRHLNWIEKVDRDGYKGKTFDYYYILDADTTYARENGFRLIKNYGGPETSLWKGK